ncbi:hypothetical protein B0A50_05020 [Salinomyces thailandicus]|uniref:NTF2-like domain-containing protein n=1 Tax=Salinomyces thailandicus TaxID=706561 RepID=A0A4U0TY68_9PEZI|nr:hypothetical protein B0A50_05020 [Salinomyces thailandica]
MHAFTAFATAALVAVSSADMFKRDDAACMTQADAQQVADNFQTLIADYDATVAENALTVDFHDYSDSVSELINAGCALPQPLGEATFTSRASFMAAQGAQPPINFQQLNVWYNCDTVFLRWNADDLVPELVTGIIVGECVKNTNTSSSQPWLIQSLYSEFNSGAWLVDVGSFVPTNCSSSSSSRRMLRA